MKKILVSIFLLVFGLCLVGCDNNSRINIPKSQSIQITKYENGLEKQTIIVKDIEIIEKIVDNFNSLKLEEMDYIKPHVTMYTFIFYDSTNEKACNKLKKVDIETTHCLTIDDGNTLYGIKNGNIDFEFVDSLFSAKSNKNKE